MTTPAFVGVGSASTNSSTTSLTPALPSGVVVGQLLVGITSLRGASSGHAVSAGWTLFAHVSRLGDQHIMLAYRFATGSDSSPTFSWTGNASARAIVCSFENAVLPPAYNVGENDIFTENLSLNGGTGTNEVYGTRTTGRDNVLVAQVCTNDDAQTLSNANKPDGYVLRFLSEGANRRIRLLDKYLATAQLDSPTFTSNQFSATTANINVAFGIAGALGLTATGDLESGPSTVDGFATRTVNAAGAMESSPSGFAGFINPHDFFEVHLKSDGSDLSAGLRITRKASAPLMSAPSVYDTVVKIVRKANGSLASSPSDFEATLEVIRATIANLVSSGSVLEADVRRVARAFAELASSGSELDAVAYSLVEYIPIEIRSGQNVTYNIRRNLAKIAAAMETMLHRGVE